MSTRAQRHHAGGNRPRSGALPCLIVATALLAGGCDVGLDDSQRLARGLAALEAGDGTAAVIDAKAVLAASPDNVDARLLLAEASFITGDFESSAFEYQRAVELGVPVDEVAPRWAESLLALGRYSDLLGLIPVSEELAADEALDLRLIRAAAMHLSGDTETARATYTEILAAYPDDEDATVGMAATFRTDGDYATARARVDAALSAHPDWLRAQLLSAELFRDERRPERTVAILEGILDTGPDELADDVRLRATAGLIAAQLVTGDFDGAAAVLGDLEEIAPEAFATRYLSAETDLVRGNITRAISTVEPLLAGAPRDVDVLILSARVRLQQGALGQAEAHLVRAFSEAPDRPIVRRLLAEVRLIQGRIEDAEDLIAPLLEQGEPDPGLLQLALRITVASGNPDEGLAAYGKALTDNPTDPDLRFGLAASQLLLGDLAAAEATLAGFSEATAGWKRPLLQALAALRRGDSTTALSEVDSVAERWPDTADVQRAAGVVAEAAGRPELAAERYERVLELVPSREQAYIDLARVRRASDAPDGARDAIRRGLDALPASAALMLAMAGIEATYGEDLDDAVRWLEAARDADPMAFAPRLALADYFRAAGDLDQAIGFAREALQLEPFNPYALYTVGIIELARRNGASAIEALIDAVERRPDFPPFRHALARAQLGVGEPEAALKTLAAIDGTTYDTELLKGFAKAAAGRTDDALATARRLEREYPEAAGPLELVGQVALSDGDFAKAADVLTRAYKLEPTADALEKATFARLRAGSEEADALMLAQLDREPADIDLRRNYAHMLAGSGRVEEAVGHYRRVLDADPDDLPSLNNLAWIYATLGDDQALPLARRAVNLAPDSPQANDTLGWILVERGELIEGTSRLRQALQQGAQDPEIRYHLAVALYRSGDRRGAESQLVRALEAETPFASRAAATELLTDLGSE